MRKLNVRFFLGLLGCTVLLIAGLALVHYFQQDRIAAAQLWQAQSARQSEQFEKAALHYERFLEFKPDDSTVMLEYAEMLEQQLEKQSPGTRNPRKIVYLLEEVLAHEGGRDDIRRRVVKYYMAPRMRRYKDAESHLDILQRKYPEDGSLFQQRAICQEQLGQYEPAVESLQKAIRFPPEQVRSYELLAWMLRKRLSRARQADDIIAEMVKEHAQTHESYLARARYRMEFGLGDITADAAEAIRLAPDNAEAILLQARAQQHNKKTADAVAVLEHGLKLYPTDPRMYRHLAWIEYFTGQHDSARKRLQVGIVNCPDAFELQTALAELLIQGKMFDQVHKIIAELKSKGVREDRIAYLTARIAVEREQWAEAVPLLEKLRPQAQTHPDLLIQANILLAHCFRQLNDDKRQLEALKRVLELDAQSIPARLGIAALYASTNRLNDAIREYEQVLILPSAPESAAVDMVRLMITRKRRSPDEKTGWPEIERRLAALEARYPNSAEFLLARSDLLAAQQKVKEAAELLAGACARSKDVRLWIQSAHYAEAADRAGLRVLDEAARRIGDHPELRLKRAAILVERSPLAARRTLLDLEQPPAAFTDEQRAQLLTGLAELYFTVQDFGNARRLFHTLATQRPNDVHARHLLVEIALRENDREALPSLLDEMRKIEPPGGAMQPMLEARHCLALAEGGDRPARDRARTLLEALLQQRPNWPLVHQCLGRLAECDDDKPKAIEHYRQAIELGDVDLHTHHRLIRLLIEAKRDGEAEQLLARAKQQGTMPAEKQRSMLALVSPLLKSGVIQQYLEQSMTHEPSDPGELVWLGKMMWDTGDRPRALATFRSVVARAPHVAEHWVTLVQALSADGKQDEARATLEAARQQLPADLARKTIANCLEVLHQYEPALKEYAEALREQPGEPLLLRRYVRLLISLGRAPEAVKVLSAVVASTGAMAKEDIAWARRNLAVLGTMDHTPEQYARAFELLKQNEAELGTNLEDMRARVVLLSRQPARQGEEPTPRRQAIDLLEKILQHVQSGREDRFALAKLYDADRNWPRAEKNYRAVIAADPKNPLPIAHLARRLLQLGKLAEAAEEVRQLERLAPGSPLYVNLRSRLQFHSGEAERLLADLTSYCSGNPNDTDGAHHAFLAGALLDEFVRNSTNPRPESRPRMLSAALSFYERSIRAHPEAVVRIVSLWSHTGQRDVALRWLRDPRMKIPLNLRASAEIAALRSAHADEAACTAVEKWLEQAAASNPEVVLDLHKADLSELRHDLNRAEALYRKVLKKDENQIVAMNNLAWVLAQRGPSTEALALVQRAISMIGPIPDLLDTRARVYMGLNRFGEAVQDLEDAIADSPTAMRYFQLALAQEKNANSAGARDAFQFALQLGFDARDLNPIDVPSFERLKGGNG